MPPTRPDPARTLFLLSSAGLVFAYGVAVGAYRIFPFEVLNRLKDAATAVTEDREMLTGTRPREFLHPARHEGEGVTRWDRDAVEPGLTLLSGFFEGDNQLRLIRSDGSVLNRWPLRFSEIWPETGFVDPPSRVPTTDWHVDVEGILLFPDGSVAFNFAGLGLTKLDPCGDIVWQVPRMTHHALEPSGRGGFWVPGSRYVDTLDVNPYPPLIAPYVNHTLLEVAGDGSVIREIPLLDFFFRNDLEALIFANGAQAVALPLGDPLHLNDIEELPAAWAGAFPDFEAGDLLLSMRDLNLLMVVDPDSLAVRWYRTGPWIRQHDPDFRPDGSLTVYNNNTDDADGSILGGSEIVRIDPATGTWSRVYGGVPEQWFYSEVRGKHQDLGDGHTLITEHGAGRVFEIDASGSVVWEFVNRFGPDEVAEVTQAVRYPEDYIERDSWTCG